MPSIAGAIIVLWLTSIAGDKFTKLLLLDHSTENFDTPTLVLLFLYGNLFCYVASYPILGFHVTRVLDFKKGGRPNNLHLNGYLATLMVCIVSLYSAYCFSNLWYLPYYIVSIFLVFQLIRYFISLRTDQIPNSQLFAFTHSLAKERADDENANKENELVRKRGEEHAWRKEYIDTYRHMREHGNSAFIFVLEITLATLCYCVLNAFSIEEPEYKLSAIGILFLMWAIPAMGVHYLGQYLERSFVEH